MRDYDTHTPAAVTQEKLVAQLRSASGSLARFWIEKAGVATIAEINEAMGKHAKDSTARHAVEQAIEEGYYRAVGEGNQRRVQRARKMRVARVCETCHDRQVAVVLPDSFAARQQLNWKCRMHPTKTVDEPNMAYTTFASNLGRPQVVSPAG